MTHLCSEIDLVQQRAVESVRGQTKDTGTPKGDSADADAALEKPGTGLDTGLNRVVCGR